MNRFASLATCCLMLAACGSDPEPTPENEEALDARGEVLEGSVSDAMLPLDRLTSQSPSLAAPERPSGGDETEQAAEVVPPSPENAEPAEPSAPPAQAAPDEEEG